MTDSEINKAIHEKVMGLRYCHKHTNCTERCVYRENISDYCSNLNAVHRAEMKAIERLSTTNNNPNVIYCRHLMVANGFDYNDLGYLYEQVIRATARQRAKAVLRATGNWEGE